MRFKMIDSINHILSELKITSEWIETDTPISVVVPATEIINVLHRFHSESTLFFDMLSCLTAIDNGPEDGTMEVVYTLYSIPFNRSVQVKVMLDREDAQVQSVEQVYKTANWHEREAFDLFGINFIGHPDLRRILLPADWEGYPLRKDYQEQEKYHHIRVKY